MATEPRLSTLQQERSRITRNKLMRTAERLWQANGFDAITVSDVCDAAGVAKGTFYFYFPRKEQLLVELALLTSDRVFEEAAAALEADESTEDVLRRVVAVVAAEAQRSDRALLTRMLVELYRQAAEADESQRESAPFTSTFVQVFRRAQRRGEVPAVLAPNELAEGLTTATVAVMLGWARGQWGNVSLETVLWRTWQLLLNGARAGAAGGC